jgi:hypothetical protein
VAWGRRPEAAALVAELAGPGRGWDAIVIGEYERAFYGSQYAAMAPLFEHYGVQLWMPEAGGRVDFSSEHDEETMTHLGLSSKREVTRTSIRGRTAMAVQVRDQGRYLGGRPQYGYRLADTGPHPNKAHATWGRRARRLEPDPETAHIVRWIFARRLAGHSAARIARALNEAGVPCPSAADPARNPHRAGAGWTLGTIATILSNPRYTGQVWNRQRTDRDLADPADACLGHKSVQRWNLPDGWVISANPPTPRWSARPISSLPRTSAPPAAPPPPRACPCRGRAGTCWPGCWYAAAAGGGWNRRGRTGKPAYRCRHGHTTASRPGPDRVKNAYIREDRILPHLPALHLQLTEPAVPQRRQRTRRGLDVRPQASPEDVIRYLRERQITLTYDPAAGRLNAGTAEAIRTITLTGSQPRPSKPESRKEEKEFAGRPALAAACAR